MKLLSRLALTCVFLSIVCAAGICAGEKNKDEQALKTAIIPKHRSLHEAAQKGDIEDMKRILALGVDVNLVDEDGIKIRRWSAITANLAAEAGAPAMASLWAADRAETGALSSTGDRPLHRAAYGDQPEAISFLLENGAAVNARNERGWTALHWAALCGNERVALALLAAGADPVARDQDDTTPLHLAAVGGYYELAKDLLLFNADVNAADKYGITPLHWAAFDGRQRVVSLLLAHGAKVNALDEQGRTPKRWAAINLLRVRGKGSVPNKLMMRGGVE